MNKKGRKKERREGRGEKKLMAQETLLHYTFFKGIISVRILQGLRVDMRTKT